MGYPALQAALDWTVGPLVVVCCVCTALAVVASVVLYDYAESELNLGSLGGLGVLVTTAIGDFLARIISPKMLRDHEYHRLVSHRVVSRLLWLFLGRIRFTLGFQRPGWAEGPFAYARLWPCPAEACLT